MIKKIINDSHLITLEVVNNNSTVKRKRIKKYITKVIKLRDNNPLLCDYNNKEELYNLERK